MPREVNAALLLDKPRGISSNRALLSVKRLFNAAKAGHCGTLDPLATGLLPICFGEATKFSRFMLDAEKTYVALLRLGETTSSGDCEGEITCRRPVTCNRRQIESVLANFLGEQTQTPPMLSALKQNGAPLYALARRGKQVERAPRAIMISRIHFIEFSGQQLKIEVRCSKGTYVRVLAEDIGAALGCGAHLIALRRTEVGPLSLDAAHTLQDVQERRDSCLLPLDYFVHGMPRVVLDDSQALSLQQGRAVATSEVAGLLRCYDRTDRFLGVGAADQSGNLRASRLLAAARRFT
jgi:tRNA pseudouridine55 synthase